MLVKHSFTRDALYFIQQFSKNYLSILMVLLFSHPLFQLGPVISSHWWNNSWFEFLWKATRESNKDVMHKVGNKRDLPVCQNVIIVSECWGRYKLMFHEINFTLFHQLHLPSRCNKSHTKTQLYYQQKQSPGGAL